MLVWMSIQKKTIDKLIKISSLLRLLWNWKELDKNFDIFEHEKFPVISSELVTQWMYSIQISKVFKIQYYNDSYKLISCS